MRVLDFIVSRKISLTTLNYICEYLFLPSVKVNSKVSEENAKSWDLTLNDESFDEWFKIRIKIDKIETDNAKKLVKELKEVANIEDFSAELCERIINSYSFLIGKSFYPTKSAEKILQIINSEKLLFEKITLLKNFHPFSEPVRPTTEKTPSHRYESYYESSYDPYENFYWGGLSGEEAYIGYWNTE